MSTMVATQPELAVQPELRNVFRAVQVFRIDESVSWLRADDEITGEDVMPGFRCRVGDFFPAEAEAPVQAEPALEVGHS
jgi:hypothetical protein